jgi:large subunit ribosomal protein L17
MRHRVDHRKLGRTSSHRLALMRNLVCALFEHGRIITTLPKAKEARRFAERAITLGKKGLVAKAAVTGAKGEDEIAQGQAKVLHYRRQAMQLLHNKDAVNALFDKVAPTYKERAGGYTRVLRAGHRLGDHGTNALFELV